MFLLFVFPSFLLSAVLFAACLLACSAVFLVPSFLRSLVSPASLVVFLLVFALEVLITLLQAFIFTTLTAFYIAEALEPIH